MNRREVLTTAPAAGLSGMIAFAGPGQAFANPGLSLADKVMHHIAEIERLLQEAAPENVTLTGVQWRTGFDDVWASGVWECPGGEYGAYRLAHFRPAYRPEWWIQAAPGIAGEDAA